VSNLEFGIQSPPLRSRTAIEYSIATT